MKKLSIIYFLMGLMTSTVAQDFQFKYEIMLPDSVMEVSPEWADIDNDGLLDLLVIGKVASGEQYLYYAKGDTISNMQIVSAGIPIGKKCAYLMLDYDRDNTIDLLISSEHGGVSQVDVYLNQGNFLFATNLVDLPPFETGTSLDFNNDTHPDLVLSGESSGNFYTSIFLQGTMGQWTDLDFTFEYKARSLQVIDADYNGYPDIFISSESSTGAQFTGFLINDGGVSFVEQGQESWIGLSAKGDFNADGIVDIVFTGSDGSNAVNKIFLSGNGAYSTIDVGFALDTKQLFVADLDSDGVPDISYLGKNASNETRHFVQHFQSDLVDLNADSVVDQRFGDYEHDGDLDLIKVIDNAGLKLSLYENASPENLAPSKAFNAVAIQVFDRVFMYWEKPEDDTSPSESLTYDVYLQTEATTLPVEFDHLNLKRLTVTPGNQLTANFKLFDNLSAANFGFSIQSIDNAFHTGNTICMGTATVCATIAFETVEVCEGDLLTLAAPDGSYWFSFKGGFLGNGSSPAMTASENDTLFYFNPAGMSCANLHAIIIKIRDTPLIENYSKYVCAGKLFRLGVESDWAEVRWYSHTVSNLGSSDSIAYTASSADSVFVELKNDKGCSLIRKTVLLISAPALTIGSDHYKIKKGESVQLNAAGADSYTWSPASWLSNSTIPNPIASPPSNVIYTVTGYDSIGCSAAATLKITVEESAFIANLFTPNYDGRNDFIRIYGLTVANDFNFSIYNREGKLVYNTNEVTEATNVGWDGSANGIEQPVGVYVWKVSGFQSGGSKILLNGKSEGSILLVR